MVRPSDDPRPALPDDPSPARAARRGRRQSRRAQPVPTTETPAGPPPGPPDARALREAALAHLARFATTRQGLEAVLNRRLLSWGRRAARAGMDDETIASAIAVVRPSITQIAADMIALGALDDRAFAESRARGLTRSGRSRRGVAAHLAQRGVEADIAVEALDEALGERGDAAGADAELGAALVLARKRRLGPWVRPDAPDVDAAGRMKILAIFARAGFSRDVAEAALSMDADEAEARIIALRSA
jgi:regulatory protein